jgi:diguanylate cyclase (GGDEF)-like protein/PAS domain S-box-containing protein
VFEPEAAARRRRSAVAVQVAWVLVLAGVIVGVAVFAAREAPLAPFLIGAVINGGYAARLIGYAWRTHILNPSGICRSAGMLGLGVLAIALTGAAISVAVAASSTGSQAPDGPHRAAAQIAATGLTLASVAFVPALLFMPGAATTLIARLRRAVDGVTMGVCLLFTAWVLAIAPHGDVDSLGFWVAVVTASVLCTAAVSALRAGRAFRGAVVCAAGVVAAEVGLGGLAFGLANDESYTTLPSAVLAAAGPLAWAGARRVGAVRTMTQPDATPTLAGYPVLAVPAAAAIAVALHKLVMDTRFDGPSVVLGIIGIVAMAVRETLAAVDVAAYARRVAAQVARFQSLVAASTDVIMVIDTDLVVRWQSAAAARQLGLSDADVVGRHLLSMVHPEDAGVLGQRIDDIRAGLGTGADGEPPALVEARLRDGFGQWRETESSISDQRDVPEVNGLVVHIRDVSERKEMERTLRRLAYADQLTGLANRRQILQSVTALRSAPRGRGALLLVELEGFSEVRDEHGYAVGDAVLIEVAQRLRAEAEDADVPGRLSGDEFSFVTEASPVHAYALATRLLATLAEPIELADVTVRLGATVGLADIAGGVDADDVLRRARLALRRARQLGRAVEWYDDAVEHAMLRRLALEEDLPGAMARGELDLVYQPVLDLLEHRPVGVEAMLRWRHAELGTLLPADIIPIAEDNGLINDIGAWALDEAGRRLASWLQDGRDLWMAVNISSHQLDGPELVRHLTGVINRYELPPERLVCEFAEAQLVPDETVGDRIGGVRSLGVRTAIDDFGAGPDSLTHLRRLPIDMVKIGRSFFGEAPPDGRPLPVIDVMVGFGRRLGIDVVAMGLEAESELDLVRAAGCRFGQGRLFAYPQPAERAEAYLDEFRARSA